MLIDGADIDVDGVAAQCELIGGLFFTGAGEEQIESLAHPGGEVAAEMGDGWLRVADDAVDGAKLAVEQVEKQALARGEAAAVAPGAMHRQKDRARARAKAVEGIDAVIDTAVSAGFGDMAGGVPVAIGDQLMADGGDDRAATAGDDLHRVRSAVETELRKAVGANGVEGRVI